MPVVYAELRRIAARCLGGRQSHTVQRTALVQEAYLGSVKRDSIASSNRIHFFAVSATLMRQIILDHARHHGAAKRGGAISVALDENTVVPNEPILDPIALDDAMKGFARLDARQRHIVELWFFGGLSIEEICEGIDISPATINREWVTACAWLRRALSEGAA